MTVQRRFRIMYHTEPPTDKTIREWFMNCFVCRWFCVVHDLKPPLHSHNWLSFGNSKTQNAFLFTVNAIFRHDYPLAVEPGSTPRPLVQTKLGEILYLLICSFLPCLSWLLRSRVRKSQRDLWITLYCWAFMSWHLVQGRRKFSYQHQWK